jgi:hypothetical protein
MVKWQDGKMAPEPLLMTKFSIIKKFPHVLNFIN